MGLAYSPEMQLQTITAGGCLTLRIIQRLEYRFSVYIFATSVTASRRQTSLKITLKKN